MVRLGCHCLFQAPDSLDWLQASDPVIPTYLFFGFFVAAATGIALCDKVGCDAVLSRGGLRFGGKVSTVSSSSSSPLSNMVTILFRLFELDGLAKEEEDGALMVPVTGFD